MQKENYLQDDGKPKTKTINPKQTEDGELTIKQALKPT